MGLLGFLSTLACLTATTTSFLTIQGRSTVPYPITSTTEIPGTGGCSGYGIFSYLLSFEPCKAGGDSKAECIPTLTGGHYCVCSPGYQLYSDGVCKRINPCVYNSTLDVNSFAPNSCILTGGVCKEDPSTRLGFTCDCTSLPSGYTNLRYDNYNCVIDPCGYHAWGCTTKGGLCTPVSADAKNPAPYVCSCPAPAISATKLDYPWAGEDCYTPTCKEGIYRSCEKCIADPSHPFGLTCGCNDPNSVPVNQNCSNPCITNLSGQELRPKLKRTELNAGNAACTLIDSNAKCYATVNSPLYYQCNCSIGFRSVFIYNTTKQFNPFSQNISIEYVDNVITCQDIDECAEPNPCGTEDPSAICTNTIGSYTCTCSPGFTTKDGKCQRAVPVLNACTKIDPSDGNPCNNNGDWNATCTPTCSTAYECQCSKGFWSNGGTCVDGNECEFSTNPCPNIGCGKKENTICRNTFGGHLCSCGNGAKCSCGAAAQCTRRSDGSMKCRCNADVYYYY